ncbi:hypothetical protein NKH77_50470 [Streptomyces sp. M19]
MDLPRQRDGRTDERVWTERTTDLGTVRVSVLRFPALSPSSPSAAPTRAVRPVQRRESGRGSSPW